MGGPPSWLHPSRARDLATPAPSPITSPAGTELHGLGARLDGRLAGLAHYFFHPAFWSGQACYLQDLFVDETLRGQGAGRALIEAVAAAARERGADRFYWHTQEGNTRARRLRAAERLT